MFKVGQYVYLNPKVIDHVCTTRGIVMRVGNNERDEDQVIDVYWEDDGDIEKFLASRHFLLV